MSKIVIAVLMSVLLAGATLYVIGTQMVPAAGTAGKQTSLQINNAFQ